MPESRSKFLLPVLLLLIVVAGLVAWWWLGEDGGGAAIRSNGSSAESSSTDIQHDGATESRPITKDSARHRSPRKAASDSPKEVAPKEPEDEGSDFGERLPTPQEVQAVELVSLSLPIEFTINGSYQTLRLDLGKGFPLEGLTGPLDGKEWRFSLLAPASEAKSDGQNAGDRSLWSPPTRVNGLYNDSDIDAYTQSLGLGSEPHITSKFRAEVCNGGAWELLAGWATGRGESPSLDLKRAKWVLAPELDRDAKTALGIEVSTVRFNREHRELSVYFKPFIVELTKSLADGHAVFQGKFVDPETKKGVFLTAGHFIGVGSSTTSKSEFVGNYWCSEYGSFFGVGEVAEESRGRGLGALAEADFTVSVFPWVSQHQLGVGPPKLESMPIPRPKAVNGVLDFGEIAWGGRSLEIIPPDRSHPYVSADFNSLGRHGIFTNGEASILADVSPCPIPKGSIRSDSDGFMLIGLPLGTQPEKLEVEGWISGSAQLKFKRVEADWGRETSGKRTVRLEPIWKHAIFVLVEHNGERLEQALVIAIPANNDELRRHAQAGTLPDFIHAVTRGYGSFDEESYTRLPYFLPVPKSASDIPGYWVAAAVNGKGAAIQWRRIEDTWPMILELGQVGTGVRTTVTATMPSLVGDSIPGANLARGMGWRGKLTYMLKAKAANEEHVRDLGQITFGEDGRGQLMANLDPSVEWRFFLHQIPEAGVYLPLHDNVEVAALGPFKVQADPAGGDTPVVDVGNVPGPRAIRKHRSTNGVLPLHTWFEVENIVVAEAKPAYAWANGHGCDPAKFWPPCVWDGKQAIPLVWVPSGGSGGQVWEEHHKGCDLPARASVLVVSNAAVQYELRVEGPWWFWGWRWEYTMPVEKGQRHRIWLPHGACKVTVSAKAEQGGAGGSPVDASNQPRPKSITINVADGWAGDHEIVMD